MLEVEGRTSTNNDALVTSRDDVIVGLEEPTSEINIPNQGNLTESEATKPIVEQKDGDTTSHHEVFKSHQDQVLFRLLNKNRIPSIGIETFYAALDTPGFRDLLGNITAQLDQLSYSQKNIFEIMFLNPHKDVSSYDWVTLTMGEIIETVFTNHTYAGRHANHFLMSGLKLSNDDMHHFAGTIPQSNMAQNFDGLWSQVGMDIREVVFGTNSGQSEFNIILKYLGPTRGVGLNCDPVFLRIQSPGMPSFNTSGNLLVPSKELERDYINLADKVYWVSTEIQSGNFKLHGGYESVWNLYGSIVEGLRDGEALNTEQISQLLKDMIRASCKEQIWEAPSRRPRFNLELFLEGKFTEGAKLFGNEYGRTKTLSLLIHYDHISIYKEGYPTISGVINELRETISKEDLDKFEKFLHTHPLVQRPGFVANSLENVGK
jgi:hypothetical protein